MEILRTLISGGILLIQSVFDIRYRQIPLWITAIGGGVGVLFMVAYMDVHMTSLFSFLPGVLCLIYGKISREAIGYGDGLLILMLGCYWNITSLLGVCMWAFSFGAIVAILLFLWKRDGRMEIPFVPFLLLGFIFERICK